MLHKGRGSISFLLLGALGCGHRAPGPDRADEKPPVPISARLQPYKGRPTLFLNGKPETPIIYSITDSPGGRWTHEEVPQWNIRAFANRGVKMFQFSIWLQDIWTRDERGRDHLDMESVRRQFRGVLEAVPGAAIFMRLHINAPIWWDRAHPEETVAYSDVEAFYQEPAHGLRRNTTMADLNGQKVHSLASVRWREETSAILRRFYSELAALPEGNALFAVNLCDGVSHEWHYWGFLDHDPDTGPAMTAYFRAFLAKRYRTDAALATAWGEPSVTLATAAVPGSDLRNRTSDGVFRDANAERRVIDYFEAQQQVVTDDVLHFAKLTRQSWPRPLLVGAFYGYYFMTFSRQTTGGHLGVDQVLRSPDVDFIAAPQSYFAAAHNMGGSGHSRAVIESALVHGKLVLDEMDQSTSLRHPFDEPPAEKIADDLAIVRRNTAHPLTRGAGMWFYDFGPNNQTGWWSHRRILEDVGALRAIFERRLHEEMAPASDVLVVWDVESYYHVAAKWTPISETTLDFTLAEIQRSGVASDSVLVTDLGKVDLSRYRVVVVANAWRMNAATRAFIRDRIATGGRHVVFMYMPGYIDETGRGLDKVAGVTGIEVRRGAAGARPEVAVTDGTYRGTFGLEYDTLVSPFPVISDARAEVLGVLAGGQDVVFARKRTDRATIWYSSLPIRGPSLWRHIFRTGGAHVYVDADDALHADGGVLWIHSAEGGKRRVNLRSGKGLDLELAPRSTVLLDARTGEMLLR
jgi:hypothetical protein